MHYKHQWHFLHIVETLRPKNEKALLQITCFSCQNADWAMSQNGCFNAIVLSYARKAGKLHYNMAQAGSVL